MKTNTMTAPALTRAVTRREPLLPIPGLEESGPIAHELIERGYGFIPFTPPAGLIKGVMRGWNEFLTLPLEERMKWRRGYPADWDDGYVNRPGKSCAGCTSCVTPQGAAMHDNKHFFHYRPHLVALLDHREVDYSRHLSWLEDLDALYKYSRNAFTTALQELDQAYPEFCFVDRFSSVVAETRHVIRLLSYNEPMQPGQLLAKAHNDRNFGTIQVFETHPALELNLERGKVKYVPRKNQALMFTGEKARNLTGRGLKAVNHAVIVPEDFVPEPVHVPRQSIVFFGHIFPEFP